MSEPHVGSIAGVAAGQVVWSGSGNATLPDHPASQEDAQAAWNSRHPSSLAGKAERGALE